MSSLSDLLQDSRQFLGRIKVIAPEPEALRAAVLALGGSGSGPTLPPEDVATLQARVIAMVRSQQADRISSQDLRKICVVFLHPPAPPGRMPDIGAAIVGELERRRLQAMSLGLFNAYLDNFKTDDPDIARLAEQLGSLTREGPGRRLLRWATRARALDLFDPKAAPKALAKAVTLSPEPAEVSLADAGLGTAIRARGRLVEAAFQIACRVCASLSPAEAGYLQKKLIDWSHDGDGLFVFPESLSFLCAALLEPWSKTEPEKTHQVHLIQTLERAGGGDPRIHPARWRAVESSAPAAYAVLMRWLTRASVMQFLDIVGRSLPDADSKRMWAYRRAFWTSYLLGLDGAPAIQRAWIAFGRNAAQLARETARRSGDESFTSFGIQNEGTKAVSHSALIIEFANNIVVVDWSHNGKYNVWRRGERGRPEFFKDSYPAGTLYDAPLMESHVAPARYTWQKNLARIIEGRTFHSEKPFWRPKGV